MPFKDPEKRKAYMHEYIRKWREEHREHYNQLQREWKRNNPKKAKAARKRYLDKLHAMGRTAKQDS